MPGDASLAGHFIVGYVRWLWLFLDFYTMSMVSYIPFLQRATGFTIVSRGTTFLMCVSVKTQISLLIHAVLLEPSQDSMWETKDPMRLQVDSEGAG